MEFFNPFYFWCPQDHVCSSLLLDSDLEKLWALLLTLLFFFKFFELCFSPFLFIHLSNILFIFQTFLKFRSLKILIPLYGITTIFSYCDILIFKLIFNWSDNCPTILCWSLLYVSTNQPRRKTYVASSWASLPPSLSLLQVVTEHLIWSFPHHIANFHQLSNSTYGNVCIFNATLYLFHPLPPSLCPKVLILSVCCDIIKCNKTQILCIV